MKIKETVISIKCCPIVQQAKEKLLPAWQLIKAGGYKVVIISILISAIFLPLGALLNLISVALTGTATTITMVNASSLINKIFYDPSIILMFMLFSFISLILSLIAFIFKAFIVGNANFRCFNVLAEEGRIVTVGEYFKLAFTGLIEYSWKYIIHVWLPLFVVALLGAIINIIPFINGNAIASFITSIAYFALVFRFFAIILNLDYNKVTYDYTNYWLTFAVVVYIVKVITSLTIVVTFFEIMFVLYALLLLKESSQLKIEK